MPMPYIPLELKALIIHEIWFGGEYRYGYELKRECALSALSFVWPDAIPRIREYRFRSISPMPGRLTSLLAILNSAPEIYDLIRSISQGRDSVLADSLSLIQRAVKVEELILFSVDLSGFNRAIAELPGSLRGCTHLRKLGIYQSHDNHLSTVFETIHSLPYLTNLKFWNFCVDDLLRAMSSDVWDEPEDFLEMWDPHDFEAPNPSIQITSLTIDWVSWGDLQFLDLIASPKTPFPKIQQIKLAGNASPIYRTERLHVLLERYKNTLRSLELDITGDYNMPVLALPSAMEHFKFSASAVTSLDTFARTLLSAPSSFKSVSVMFDLTSEGQAPPDTTFLDEVLAGIPSLERLDIKVHVKYGTKWLVEQNFPRCMEKHEQGGLSLRWRVDTRP